MLKRISAVYVLTELEVVCNNNDDVLMQIIKERLARDIGDQILKQVPVKMEHDNKTWRFSCSVDTILIDDASLDCFI